MDLTPSKRGKRCNSLDGNGNNDVGTGSSSGNTIPTLVFLCRTVVTVNLERYTPESFRICDIYEWEEIIQLRHAMTQPQNNSSTCGTISATRPTVNYNNNDLDGHGRLLPAISEKVLLPIEECNDHLNDSVVADTLVWKDCVEYHFKRSVGFLIRPPTLFVPWPILVQQIQTHCGSVLSSLNMEDQNQDSAKMSNNAPSQAKGPPTPEEIANAIHILQTTTWSIALLRDTGMGKTVKRSLKLQQSQQNVQKTSKHNNHTSCNIITMTEAQIKILQQLLSGWMNLAKSNPTSISSGIYQWKEDAEGVENITTSTTKSASSSSSSLPERRRSLTHTNTSATDHHHHPSNDTTVQNSQDLHLLEKCLSWRQLYQVLDDRKRHIQATQGQRMREIRNQVSMSRPKLVKVRPTAKATQLQSKLDPSSPVARSSSSSNSPNDKVAMLRNESSIQAGRLKMTTKKPSFGDAVAFAAITKKGMAHKRKVMGGTVVQYNNGTKRMKIPASFSSTTGTTKALPSRQFASKYKPAPPIAQNSKKKK